MATRKILFLFLLIFIISCSNKPSSFQETVSPIDSVMPDSLMKVKQMNKGSISADTLDYLFALNYIKEDPVKIKNEKTIHSKFALTLFNKNIGFLFGKLPLDSTIFLINNKSEKIFKAKTVKYSSIVGPSNTFVPLTLFSPLPPKSDLTNYDFCIFDSIISNYIVIKPEKLEDLKQKQFSDSLIKHSKEIESLFDPLGNMKLKVYISNELPIVSHYRVDKTEFLIASYKNRIFGNLNGPQFIIYKSKVYGLTFPCSYIDFFVFKINDRIFIQSGLACCDCGASCFQISEVIEDMILDIYKDASYSN